MRRMLLVDFPVFSAASLTVRKSAIGEEGSDGPTVALPSFHCNRIEKSCPRRCRNGCRANVGGERYRKETATTAWHFIPAIASVSGWYR